jgi:thiamine transporter ThiT
MRKAFIQIVTIVAITLTGTAGAVVVGLLVYGSNVFNIQSPGFSFVSFGLSGALIFAFYHVRGLSEAITASVVASCAQFIAGSAFITMLKAIIFSFGLNIPVIVLAFVFERKLAAHRRIKFAVVSLTYGAMFVLLTLVSEAVSGGSGLPATLFRENFVDGLLLGLGLGLGLEAGEALLYSFERMAAGKPSS